MHTNLSLREVGQAEGKNESAPLDPVKALLAQQLGSPQERKADPYPATRIQGTLQEHPGADISRLLWPHTVGKVLSGTIASEQAAALAPKHQQKLAVCCLCAIEFSRCRVVMGGGRAGRREDLDGGWPGRWASHGRGWSLDATLRPCPAQLQLRPRTNLGSAPSQIAGTDPCRPEARLASSRGNVQSQSRPGLCS